MMKKIVLIFGVVFYAVCFYNCRSNKVSVDFLKGLTVINLDSLEEANLLLSNYCFDSLRKFYTQGHVFTVADGWPDSLRVIKLETSIECLLGAIKKIEFADSLIFIGDYNKNLYIFDINGRFLNQIAEIGRDPNQVANITSFYVDKSRKIVGVYDGFSRSIHRYSYSGIKQDKISCGENVKSNRITDVNLINDEELLLTLSSGPEDLYNYAVISAEDGSLKKYVLPYRFKYLRGSGRGDLSCFARPAEKLWLTALLSDTIYEYDKEKITPKFVVKSNLTVFNEQVSDGKKEWDSPAEVVTFLRSNGCSIGLSQIWTNTRYLYFDVFCGDCWYGVYYDYVNNKGYKYKQYSRGNVLMPGRFLATTSDAFVSYVSAYDFVHQPEGCIDVDRPLWHKLREQTFEDDNPILLFYYIRK